MSKDKAENHELILRSFLLNCNGVTIIQYFFSFTRVRQQNFEVLHIHETDPTKKVVSVSADTNS